MRGGRFVIDAVVPRPTVSEARLSSMLDTAVDGIVVIDEQARILVFNRACERMFGYTSAEMLGQNVKAIMPSGYAKAHDRYVASYITTGVKRIIGIGREVRGRHKDGGEFPAELTVGEAATPEGRQFIGILRDLRPRKEAEHRLSQLQGDLLHMARVSAMDEMGAALAHELNQPLTALMLYLQAAVRANEKVARGERFSDETRIILDKAVGEAERAASIIQRMRQFVEKRDPVRRLVLLGPLIDDAIELTLIGNWPPVHIRREVAPDLPLVLVDPIQIQQVMVNLVRNAIQAVKGVDAAEIVIMAQDLDDKVEIVVEDNGPGIPAASLPGLFKAFAAGGRNGLGIGLAISRSIAQNHGGDLIADPGGNGRGARFVLHLPMPPRQSP